MIDKDLVLRTLDLNADSLIAYLSWLQDKSNIFIEATKRDWDLQSLSAFVNQCNLSSDTCLLAIFYQGLHVGNIKFDSIDNTMREAWVGILIGNKEFRGLGLATRALDLGCTYFNNQGIYEFFLGVNLDNKPAIIAYEKAGFKYHRDHKSNSVIMKKSLSRK